MAAFMVTWVTGIQIVKFNSDMVMEWYISGLFVSNTDLTFGREDWNKPEGAQLHTEVFKLVWGEI